MQLLDFLIPAAYAQTTAPAPQSTMGTFLLPLLLIAVMYFLMIRPQMKRAKEHRAMLAALNKGDEVLTNGGLAGVVTAIGESFVTIEIAENVRVRVQKGAVLNVLPKGSLKAN